MNKLQINIRESTEHDIDAMYSLYSQLLTMGTGSLHVRPPDESEVARCKVDAARSGCPCFVAEVSGSVLGFGYAEVFGREHGYRYTVREYVYVHPEAQGEGVATQLLAALIEECTKRGFRQMITYVGDSKNVPAIKLHKKCGFEEVGRLKAVGFKFDRWLDTIVMQRTLGDGNKTMPGD